MVRSRPNRERKAEGPRGSTAGRRPPVPPFQDFLEANRTIVYRFLLSAAGPGDADDCFQETFLSALRAYPRLRDGEHLRTWVLTIATRKAIDAGRARSRRPRPSEEAAAIAERRAALQTETGNSTTADPEDPLWGLVATLPAKQRAAVVHRHVMDRSYEEIAELMGSTEEAARANVSEGIRKLRAVMEGR
jgi:RNA polymerase sigma factor (sigma-70 family)